MMQVYGIALINNSIPTAMVRSVLAYWKTLLLWTIASKFTSKTHVWQLGRFTGEL